MKKKIDWEKVDQEFEQDIKRIKHAEIDIKEYRKKKTSAKEDAEVANKALKKTSL